MRLSAASVGMTHIFAAVKYVFAAVRMRYVSAAISMTRILAAVWVTHIFASVGMTLSCQTLGFPAGLAHRIRGWGLWRSLG
jgi:hypothetical protein